MSRRLDGSWPTPSPVREHGAAPTRETLPHLSAFLAGYLHQDFLLDHRTPRAALAAFIAESTADQRLALRDEWTRFRDLTGDLAWVDVRRLLASLGAGWSPPSRRALLGLFAALGG